MICPKCGYVMTIDKIIDCGFIIIAHCSRCGYENHPEYSINVKGEVVWKYLD